MKKYVLMLALVASSSCFSFPEYTVVDCHGKINQYDTFVQYNRTTHRLMVTIDKSTGEFYGYESLNRIFTSTHYDKEGNSLAIEVISNSKDWLAKLYLHLNNQLHVFPVVCKKVELDDQKTQSAFAADILSKLNGQ